MEERADNWLHRNSRRIVVLAVMVALLAAVVAYGMLQQLAARPLHRPFFASYIDATASPALAFQDVGAALGHTVILSFVVSSRAGACAPAWGAAYSLDRASAFPGIDKRIAEFQKRGGNVMVAFGGYNNKELAVACKDPAKLLAAYRSVIDRYNVSSIDLDLEGDSLTDTGSISRLATAMAALQSERMRQKQSLSVWVTLPTTPPGFTANGVSVVSQLLANGVDLAGVNAMTMDYKLSQTEGRDVLGVSTGVLERAVSQLDTAYQSAGIWLDSAALWSKLGMTPMIGQNDTAGMVFTLADAKGMNQFAVSHGMGRVSMWSANRDAPCAESVPGGIVSNSCSGVKQEKWAFASALKHGLK